MKNLNKKFIIISTITSLFIVIFVVFLVNNTSKNNQMTKNEDLLIEREGVDKEFWSRKIQVEENTYINSYDGYKITLPDNWTHTQEIDPLAGFVAYKDGGVDIGGNLSGITLRIKTYEASGVTNINEWLLTSKNARVLFPKNALFRSITKNAEKALKAVFPIPLTEEPGELNIELREDVDLGEVVIENTQKTVYLFLKNNTIYMVSCSTGGENYIQLTEECENTINSFQIL